MMYKNSDPSERYNHLNEDQLLKVDQFVLRLTTGEAVDEAEFYKIKKENEILKERLEALNTTNV